jgi:hypothetical protein
MVKSMSEINPKLITAVAKSTPNIAILSVSLGWTYLTLDWKVRRARKAFEKQLMAEGMSKKDAEQLSMFYVDLKNNLTAAVKHGITSRGFR